MNHATIEVVLSDARVPATVDEIWRRHCLLCPFDDERCTHVEEMLEAFVADLAGWDEKLGDQKAETEKEESRAIDFEKDLDEARERIQELEAEAVKGSKLSEVDSKTKAISLGRREAEEFFLTRLRAAMAGPAKDLRREVNAIVVDTIRKLNEGTSA